MSNRGYETKDMLGPALLWGSVAMLVITLVGMGAGALYLRGVKAMDRSDRDKVHPMAEYREGPTGPVLQSQTTNEIVTYRHRETALLTSFGWIDPEQGVVRVPVSHAMRLALRDGFPVAKEAGK
ncbi:MAG: hypothetical protein ACYTGN_16245 [Planctomycetota bacterium]|jgi:hypothetical protein